MLLDSADTPENRNIQLKNKSLVNNAQNLPRGPVPENHASASHCNLCKESITRQESCVRLLYFSCLL